MDKSFSEMATVEYGITQGADFFINRDSGIPVMPLDLMKTDVISITLNNNKNYLKGIFCNFEFLYVKGFWSFKKVTVNAINNIQLGAL